VAQSRATGVHRWRGFRWHSRTFDADMIPYEDQELDRLTDPGIPDDIKWLARRLDESIAHWTKKTYDALRRQESPNPTNINLNPNALNPAAAPGNVWTSSARMRAYALTFSGGTANEIFELRFGRGSVHEWIVPASPAPFTLPLDIVFDVGTDVQVVDVTTGTATNWRCRVWAYVEVEDGND